MMPRRVVITGVGLVSSVGIGQTEVADAIRWGRHGIRTKPEWVDVVGTGLAAEVKGLRPTFEPRKKVRGMGRVARLALAATGEAIDDARLSREQVRSPEVGMAYGSAHGTSPNISETSTSEIVSTNSLIGYLKLMGHTCAANLGLYYGITGRVIPTLAGCVSSSMALGAGYDTIRLGYEDVMICGGAEELQEVDASAYSFMRSLSLRYNDKPEESPRPFDVDREGVVMGEGAATLILEELDHARRREAQIYGEIIGFGSCCDGTQIFIPTMDGMARALTLALHDAGIAPEEIDYVNAHAPGTVEGDIVESQAIFNVFGENVPVSSTKSIFGHTVGACGAMEMVICLMMMRGGFLVHTRNLHRPDPRCAALDYITGNTRKSSVDTIMTNNFAFGGITTSLIVRKL